MIIALHNPSFIFEDQRRNFNGYNLEFLRRFVGVIYLSKPWHYPRYVKRLQELGIEPERFRFTFTVRALNRRADALLSFNGTPYHPFHAPPAAFEGLKVYHVMDYVFRASEAYQALLRGGTDRVMGYCRHDRHSPFFQRYYPGFADKVVAVPFGFGSRFRNERPFQERINRCIALGSVNPVDDPLCPPGLLTEYVAFYRDEVWTHRLRRALAEHQGSLADVMDSKLPAFPETKNPHYDAVQELVSHTVFVNDQGLLNFPPARTYEGIACGTVMIAPESPIYSDLGFEAGVNYIPTDGEDLGHFRRQLEHYLGDPARLLQIHERTLELAQRYTHVRVAETLFQEIQEIRA